MRHVVYWCLLCLLPSMAEAGAESFSPDPLSVRRHEAGYRYPQNGWTVVHIEGEPYDRGFQHGKLLAKEIESYIATLAEHRAPKNPVEYWDVYRDLVGSLYLRRIDREYLEEMKGIAEGAAAGGAKIDGRAVDLTDIAIVNLWVELACLGDALRATPTGVEDVKASKKPAVFPAPPQEHHCSAFAATGSATADGKIVFGHITMWNIHQASHFYVWIDIKPTKGHRVVMQTFPGGIYSGMDYYISSSGLMMTETTIEQTRFNPEGRPLATRARKALQYSNTIDELVAELTDRNNGLYTNEWLIGDAKTNEISVLEQGTNVFRLRRSSQKQWLLKGVEGFYWGCNNAKDLQVRLETVASLNDRPEDVSWRPSDRDRAWLSLYRQHAGKIDVNFGKLAYSGPPLAKLRSLDAKVTTTDLAKNLQAHAVQGPPYGRVWEAEPWQKEKFKILRPLIPNDWTIMTTNAPEKADRVVADLNGKLPPANVTLPPTKAAWHGTLLPKTDSDLWLTTAFARYEKVVATENAFRHNHAKLTVAEQQELDLQIFRYRSDYLSAKAARPAWQVSKSAAPSPLDAELDRSRWHREQTAFGVLTLEALRKFLGHEVFSKAMDEFGLAHAGKEVTVKEFVEFVGKGSGKDVEGWLTNWTANPKIAGPAFATTHWLDEPESILIVYGTSGDVAANKASAEAVQTALRYTYGNFIVPMKKDSEVTDEDLKDKHLCLIGRPTTNTLTKRFAPAFPVSFGSSSVKVGSRDYAHEGTALITVGTNPLNARYSAILMAGLSAESLYRISDRATFPLAEVILYPQGESSRRLTVTKSE